MKIANLTKFAPLAALSLLSLSIIGCSSAFDETDELSPALPDQQQEDGWNTCDMNFSASAPTFDASTSRADGDNTWSDGATVYINFEKADGSSTYGNAVYSASTESWKLSYDGRLSADAEYGCTVYYFEGSGFSSNSLKTVITTDQNTAIYTATGTYTYSDGTVNLSATLTPYTSRIKFNDQGSSYTYFYLRGIDYVSEIDITSLKAKIVNTGDFSESTNGISAYSSTSVTSRYIYGFFHTEKQTMGFDGLRVKVDNYIYTYDFPENADDFMQVGTSGYMTLPTADSHNGWYVSEYINKNHLTSWSTSSSYSSSSSNNYRNLSFTINGKALFIPYFSKIYSPNYYSSSSSYYWYLQKSDATDYLMYHSFNGYNYNGTPSIFDYEYYGCGILTLDSGTYKFYLSADYWSSSGYVDVLNF